MSLTTPRKNFDMETKQRIERTEAHVQESKEKRKKTQKIWKEIDEDQ